MSSSRERLPELLALILAFVSGILAFSNYFFQLPLLVAPTQFLLKTTVLVSGAALMIAAINLLWRHMKRTASGDVGSILLVTGFIVAFVAGLLPDGFHGGVGGWLYQWVLAPGMAAVFALLPIFLAYALYRHLSVREIGGFLLFLGMIIVLLGQMPSLIAYFPFLAAFRHDLLIGPTAAAFRGVIFGVATGVVLAILLKTFSHVRFLIASERHGEDEGSEQ